MRAMLLENPRPIEENPLKMIEVPDPKPGAEDILIAISACGLCHTDLHVIEGELPPKKLPVIPGHQIVGVVEEAGEETSRFKVGDRVGVPWLYSTCGECEFCKRGYENLCTQARFTGYDVDGGYAEYICAPEDFVFSIPQNFTDLQAAPLLCAGAIGFRAFRLTGIGKGEILGLFGFGASAHLVIQVAIHQGTKVFVFSRSEEHRKLATELGAAWTGLVGEETPEKLHSAIVFAPSGKIVLDALRVVGRGGTVVLAGIYMTPIPEIDYQKYLYHERTVRSVTNCTRKDVQDFLQLGASIPVKTEFQTFRLDEANRALNLLKRGEMRGAGVLDVR